MALTLIWVKAADLKTVEGKDMRNFTGLDVVGLCIFLSPSTMYVLVYLGGYFSLVLGITYVWRDVLDDINIKRTPYFLWGIVAILLFVICQNRELRRFHEQKKQPI